MCVCVVCFFGCVKCLLLCTSSPALPLFQSMLCWDIRFLFDLCESCSVAHVCVFCHTRDAAFRCALAVAETRGGKGKAGGPEDELDNVTPINQSVAMAIAGNPFNTLARNALASMASVVRILQSPMYQQITHIHTHTPIATFIHKHCSCAVFCTWLPNNKYEVTSCHL